MSVFICENRKNPWVAGGSAPKPPVAVILIEDHSYLEWSSFKSAAMQIFVMQKSEAMSTCGFSLALRFLAKKGLSVKSS